MRALIVVAIAALPGIARAQPEPEPQPPAPQPPAPQPSKPDDEMAKRMDELEDKLEKLEREQRIDTAMRDEVQGLLPMRRFISVILDAGAFAVGGDGSGIRSDIGHFYFPQYAGRIAGQWVFMGDPLSTAINSLGEPADTSDSREIPNDTIHSGGHPTMIVNSIGLAIRKDVRDNITLASLVQLLPRPNTNVLDIELAFVKYRPLADVNLEINAGKIDSVLGVEYRSQDALNRIGVAPSLICRYTCGRPVGIQARLVQNALSLSGSITNGDSFDSRFEPATMLKANALPTASGHVQYTLPIGQGLEVGVSGAIGPQTGQSDLGIAQWHLGFDAKLKEFHGWEAVAEYVQGLQQGKTMSITPCDAAPCLSYKGAYLLVDRLVNPRFTPYVRIDWRDALHQSGSNFIYESHVARATLGARFSMTSRILGKIEYTFNHELDGIPQFADDVLTSSIVVATD